MGKIKEKKEELRKQKEEFLSQRFKVLHKESDHQLKNHLDQAREKGASTWLSTLPLKDLNYVLNRQEFQDSIRLRYGWKIQGVPSKCACGNVNSIYHALDCKLGGYVSMRHNAIRDTAAFFLQKAKCKDVGIEPALLTVKSNQAPSQERPTPRMKPVLMLQLSDCMHPLKEHSLTLGSHILTVTQTHLRC